MNSGHRVLLLTHFAGITPRSDYCNITLSNPLKGSWAGRLVDYELIILPYAVFCGEDHVYTFAQEVFEKQMQEALDRGSWVCFLHYDEAIPATVGSEQQCRQTQVGYRFLSDKGIAFEKRVRPVVSGTLKRNEFKKYFDRCGASKICFGVRAEYRVMDVGDGWATGLELLNGRGRVLYLPFQAGMTIAAITEGFCDLIDCLITYRTRCSREVPQWAAESLFPEERVAATRVSEIREQIVAAEASLAPYQEAKTLAFLAEHAFESDLPAFISSAFGIPTERLEKYEEDFWLLDGSGKRIAICEAKSTNRGCSKAFIYSAYNHREANNLGEDFPALLFVNAHLNASSWQEKLKPIDPQDYQVAAKDGVLIMRVEDLLGCWYLMRQGNLAKDNLLAMLLTEKGWIQVVPDFSFHPHPKRTG